VKSKRVKSLSVDRKSAGAGKKETEKQK